VSILHALWDSMHQISVVLTLLLTGTPWQYNLLARGYIPQPTGTQIQLITFLDWAGLMLVSGIGIIWLVVVWNRSPHARPPATALRVPTGRPATAP
jgi:hypothetical protein